MKTTLHGRLARLAGLLLLLSVVFATGALSALAAGGGAGSSTASSTLGNIPQGLTAAQRHHYFGPPQSVVALPAQAGTEGRGGVALTPFTPTGQQGLTAAQGRNDIGHFQPVATILATQPASSSSSDTSAWIAGGVAAAIFVVGFAAWALTRRRRQPGEPGSPAYCAQHPDDALCTAA
jgi:hypothetical protein